jgi:hypothetical protein
MMLFVFLLLIRDAMGEGSYDPRDPAIRFTPPADRV